MAVIEDLGQWNFINGFKHPYHIIQLFYSFKIMTLVAIYPK